MLFDALLFQRFRVARMLRKDTYIATIQEQGDCLGIAHQDLEYPEIGKTPAQTARLLKFLIA